MPGRQIARAWSAPLTRLTFLLLTRGGYIGLSDVAKFLRCTLLEIPDEIVAKLRRTSATAGGVGTEASERNLFVRCVGPTATSKKGQELQSVDTDAS